MGLDYRLVSVARRPKARLIAAFRDHLESSQTRPGAVIGPIAASIALDHEFISAEQTLLPERTSAEGIERLCGSSASPFLLLNKAA